MLEQASGDTAPTALEVAFVKAKPALAGVAVFSFFINILMLATPLYMLAVFQRVLTSGSSDTLLFLTLVVIFALMVMGALLAVRSWLLAYIGSWLGVAVGETLVKDTLHSPLGVKRPSDTPLRDLSQLQTFLSSPGLITLMDIPWTPLFVVVIFFLHPWLGVYSLLSVVFLFVVAIINEYLIRKPQQSALTLQSSSLQYAEQVGRNVEVVQALGMEDDLVRRWTKLNDLSADEQYLAGARSAALTGTSRFLRLGIQVGVLAVGAALVLGPSEFSAGQMIAASMLLGRALAPIDQAMGSWRSVIAARASFGRLQALQQQAPPSPNTTTLPIPKGNLEVTKMSFSPPGTDLDLLKDISFKLAAGESLGVIGPSAAGKSSLCRMLVGVWTPTVGSVRLDSAEIQSWQRSDLGRHIGYLPQDVELFAGTVRDNIDRMSNADDERVIEAAILADVHDMILRMPEGYETEIGPGGMLLSAGQRQRIGFARAVFGKPSLLVLDEPNANLDRVGEVAILRALEKLKQAKTTVVVVAHHPAVLQQVDKLMFINAGKVEAFGPRDQIMEAMNRKIVEAKQALRTTGGDEVVTTGKQVP
jgi:ATP-binding cassette, subfamily C, type I secretion system permease/ATPase